MASSFISFFTRHKALRGLISGFVVFLILLSLVPSFALDVEDKPNYTELDTRNLSMQFGVWNQWQWYRKAYTVSDEFTWRDLSDSIRVSNSNGSNTMTFYHSNLSPDVYDSFNVYSGVPEDYQPSESYTKSFWYRFQPTLIDPASLTFYTGDSWRNYFVFRRLSGSMNFRSFQVLYAVTVLSDGSSHIINGGLFDGNMSYYNNGVEVYFECPSTPMDITGTTITGAYQLDSVYFVFGSTIDTNVSRSLNFSVQEYHFIGHYRNSGTLVTERLDLMSNGKTPGADSGSVHFGHGGKFSTEERDELAEFVEKDSSAENIVTGALSGFDWSFGNLFLVDDFRYGFVFWKSLIDSVLDLRIVGNYRFGALLEIFVPLGLFATLLGFGLSAYNKYGRGKK